MNQITLQQRYEDLHRPTGIDQKKWDTSAARRGHRMYCTPYDPDNSTLDAQAANVSLESKEYMLGRIWAKRTMVMVQSRWSQSGATA